MEPLFVRDRHGKAKEATPVPYEAQSPPWHFTFEENRVRRDASFPILMAGAKNGDEPAASKPGHAESADARTADMNKVSDEVLVTRTCAGESIAYSELVSRYENAARVVALKYVRNHHVAEDVVQQAFLRGYEKLGTLRDRSRFGSWLMRIVQNEACNFATRSNHATAQLTEASERELAADTECLDDDTHLAVRLLNLLPEHERLVISLHYMDGHSVTEIAQMTGRPIGTVTKQLSRATKRLQSQVKREESRQ